MKKIFRIVLEKDDISFNKFAEIIKKFAIEHNRCERENDINDMLFIDKSYIIDDMYNLFSEDSEIGYFNETRFIKAFGIEGLDYEALREWYFNYARDYVDANPSEFAVSVPDQYIPLNDILEYDIADRCKLKLKVSFNNNLEVIDAKIIDASKNKDVE